MTPAVFDCNVFLQTMLSTRGAAHACWQRILAGEVQLFVCPGILDEMRDLPSKPKLRRFSYFTFEVVEEFIRKLLEVSTLVADPKPAFSYSRDPDDALYVDLAVVTGSLLVVSNDKDLLDLMNDDNVDGRQLRQKHPDFCALTPRAFIDRLDERGTPSK